MFGFGDNAARLRIGAEMAARGLRVSDAVHPAAVVSPSAQIGPAASLRPGDCQCGCEGRRAGDRQQRRDRRARQRGRRRRAPEPEACLSGWVRVGQGSWIGSGAVVRDRITIGARCVVGVGSVVVGDIPDAAMAYGCPARVVRALE
jgi:acetyltransferase-like isoleucine patch superfamily enzyme